MTQQHETPLCPHCGEHMGKYAKVYRRFPGGVTYACGTAIVDGELRLGNNCKQFVEGVHEMNRLKNRLEGIDR